MPCSTPPLVEACTAHNHDNRGEIAIAVLILPQSATMMRPHPSRDGMPMKVNNWVLAIVLFALAASMYGAILFKMS